MKNISKWTKRSGFTLVEIMIVIVLISILSIAGLQAMSKTQRQFRMKAAYDQMLTMIQKARSNALTGLSVIDCSDVNNDGATTDQVVAAGYGVYIQKDKTILFTDLHNTAGSGGYNTQATTDCPADPVETESALDSQLTMFLQKVNMKDPDANPEDMNSLSLIYGPLNGEFTASEDPVSAPINTGTKISNHGIRIRIEEKNSSPPYYKDILIPITTGVAE